VLANNPPCTNDSASSSSVEASDLHEHHDGKGTQPLEAQAVRFDFAAQKLNLDDGLWKILRYPNREIIRSPARADG